MNLSEVRNTICMDVNVPDAAESVEDVDETRLHSVNTYFSVLQTELASNTSEFQEFETWSDVQL